MIYQRIDGVDEFQEAFELAGRGDQFTRNGLEIIFDHLNSLGEDIELDVIAICCEYSEYNDVESLWQDYRHKLEEYFFDPEGKIDFETTYPDELFGSDADGKSYGDLWYEFCDNYELDDRYYYEPFRTSIYDAGLKELAAYLDGVTYCDDTTVVIAN